MGAPPFRPLLTDPARTPDWLTQAITAARQRLSQAVGSPYGQMAMTAVPLIGGVLEHNPGVVEEELPGASMSMGERDPLADFRVPTRPTAPLSSRGPQTWPDPANPYPMKTRPFYGPHF